MQAFDQQAESLVEEGASRSTEIVSVTPGSGGPRQWGLQLTYVAAMISVLLVMLGATEYCCGALRAERARKSALPDAALVNTQLRDRSRLERYQWVDRKAGVLRIPVKRAVDLVLAQYAGDSGSEHLKSGAE